MPQFYFEGLPMPSGIQLRSHGEDLMMLGKDLDAERYQEIRGALPADIQARVIGWRKTGGSPCR